MNDKINSTINVLTPFKRFCMTIGELPASYLETMTYYEMLLWFTKYLSETVIPTINNNAEAVSELQELFVKLQDYVNTYFDNLDVQEEVNHKLDEMVEDGSLINLIKSYAVINEENYLTNVCLLQYRHSTSNNFGLQGGCYCGDGNVANYFTASSTIEIISLSTGQTLRSASFDILGHGNSICKKGDYLYICGTGTNNNNVYKIPYNDLSECVSMDVYGDNKIPSGVNISNIAYDKINDNFYLATFPYHPETTIYKFNGDFSELLETYNISINNEYGGTACDITVWNNYLCILYNKGRLDLYEIPNNLTLYKTVSINPNVGSLYAGEYEMIDSFRDNKLIISCVGKYGESYGNGVYFFAETSLYSSSRNYPVFIDPSNLGYIKTHSITVDNTASNNPLRNGTDTLPFTSLYEAINSSMVEGYDVVNIYVKGYDYSNDTLAIYGNNNIKIYNANSNYSNPIIVKNIIINNVNYCILRDIYTEAEILVEYSNVIFKSTVLNSNNILDLNVNEHSTFRINSGDNATTISGNIQGILNKTTNNRIYGLVGLYNTSSSEYSDFCVCRNINNCYCRLRPNSWSPNTNLKFKTNKDNGNIIISLVVGSGVENYLIPYYHLNYPYIVRTNNSANDIITVTRTEENSIYTYDVSVSTSNIGDAYIMY